MYVEGEGSRSVANYTGKYTPEQGAVYAKACKVVCDKAIRKSKVQDGTRRFRNSQEEFSELYLLQTSMVQSNLCYMLMIDV